MINYSCGRRVERRKGGGERREKGVERREEGGGRRVKGGRRREGVEGRQEHGEKDGKMRDQGVEGWSHYKFADIASFGRKNGLCRVFR